MKISTTPSLAALLIAASLASPAAGQVAGSGVIGPVDVMTDGVEDLFVPAGVRGAGSYGSFFVTDIWIRAGGTGTATIAFHAADSPSYLPTATLTLNVTQPVTYIPDVMLAGFGITSGFGNIRISAPFPIAASVRVSNRVGAGAYGVSFLGIPAKRALVAMPEGSTAQMDEYAMYMTGLLPEPGSRVNVNVVNTSATASSGVLEVVDADGTEPAGTGPVTFPFALAGYSNHQFGDILLDVHSKLPEGDAGLQVRVRVGVGSAIAYAVVNENQSNDGYVIVGSIMNGGNGMGVAGVGGPGGIRNGNARAPR